MRNRVEEWVRVLGIVCAATKLFTIIWEDVAEYSVLVMLLTLLLPKSAA